MPTTSSFSSWAASSLALGVQRWGLHRRIALHIVLRVGTNPTRMVLGFMLATARLSMWISNTATALMMLPIALAVVASLREVAGGRSLGGFGAALLLGHRLLGLDRRPGDTDRHPTQYRLSADFQILYPQAPTISFGRWLFAFLPLVVVFLPRAWFVLTRVRTASPRERRLRAARSCVGISTDSGS